MALFSETEGLPTPTILCSRYKFSASPPSLTFNFSLKVFSYSGHKNVNALSCISYLHSDNWRYAECSLDICSLCLLSGVSVKVTFRRAVVWQI